MHDTIYDIAKTLCDHSQNISDNHQSNTNGKLYIVIADITTMEVDAIVNAANSSLLGGGGVDGAIHRAGGKAILKECRFLRETRYTKGLPVGEAIITTAGEMSAKYVIHTVGPKYTSDSDPKKHLASCYENSLLLADRYKCTSIAFPAISTGIFGYPKEEAAQIAYETVVKTLNRCRYVKEVYFVFYHQEDAVYMERLLE